MTEVLVVSQEDVARLLPMATCVDLMEETLRALAEGRASMPLRSIMPVPGADGMLGLMPAALAYRGVFGAKIISVFPGNLGTELESHQGMVLLFEAEHGRPLSLVDASEITAIRTAAVSAAATRVLAREDSTSLALLGSGTQARTHVEAMLLVRPIERITVWSRPQEHARDFVRREESRWSSSGRRLEWIVADTAEDAVAGADILCTTTSAREPVLRGEWLPGGVHINAVGFNGPTGREIDSESVRRSRLFVDRVECTLAEAGEFVMARAEGVIDDGHILGELGDLLLGKIEGRRSSDEITMFRSVGLAVEDLAAAEYVYGRAKQEQAGTPAPLGGLRHRED